MSTIDFPFLKKGIVYLDTAASAQKPKKVIDAIRDFYETSYANVHRGAYDLAEQATRVYEGARKKVAEFIGGKPSEIVFVRNATEAINLVARSWGAKNVKRGDVIVLTQMEHHSNIVPWQMLARRVGARLDFVPITKSGELDIVAAQKFFEKRPKLFACTHVSNVLGTVNPVNDLVKLAQKKGAKVLIDACQSVAHMPVDVQDIGCDFLVFSGHKLYGPEVGVLFARGCLLDSMPPFLGGGEMIKEVSFSSFVANDVPWKFEAGTPNIAGAVGLGAAVAFLEKIGMKKIYREERALTAYAYEELSKISQVKIVGPKIRAGLISFTFGDMHAHDVSSVLDELGICARSGQHCAQPLLGVLGVPALVRVSFGLYNSKKDVDKLISGLKKAKEVFKL